jgi:hypothetical protein
MDAVKHWVSVGLVAVLAGWCMAQAGSAPEDPPGPPPAEPRPIGAADRPVADDQAEAPSADQVLGNLLRRRQENTLIEPSRTAPVTPAPGAPDAPVTLPGTAPQADSDGKMPSPEVARHKLQREGSFVLMRRGRLMRAVGAATTWMYVFDADDQGMADPPMYLMPCQMLEDMERIVAERGDSVSFVVSGQVFVYRDANYLLPTLMKLAPRRGNLQP